MKSLRRLLALISGRWRKSLPTAPVREEFRSSPVFDRLVPYLSSDWTVGLLYFDIASFHQFEQVHGSRVAQDVLSRLGGTLEEMMPGIAEGARVVAIQHMWGDDYFVYVAQQSPATVSDMAALAERARAPVEARLNSLWWLAACGGIKLHVGAALLEGYVPDTTVGSLVYQAAKQATAVAKGTLQSQTLEEYAVFARVVQSELRSTYQPIVELSTGRILGWEALMRGPVGTPFETPVSLLAFADVHGQTWALERAARAQAFAGLGPVPSGAKVFINVNPHCMADPEFAAGQTLSLVRSLGLRPDNVVMEITERTGIDDFAAFRRLVQHYREQGYLIAVDDMGAGYSGLQAVAELRPDFIKIDMALVRNCNTDPVKEAMLEAISAFANKMGCRVVAEGIETVEELRTVMRAGLHYGQGFYLARPAAPPPGVSARVERAISRVHSLFGATSAYAGTVASLTEPAPVVQQDVAARDVASLLKAEEAPDGVVVVDGDRPVGLVMTTRLYRHLGVKYGVPLYYDRPVALLMDRTPLVVEGSTSLDEAARMATLREHRRRYDLVVVVEEGRYCGVVQVHRLLGALAEERFYVARRTNPLTDLPGNRLIQEALLRRQASGQAYSVIYADLDAFKVYNDNYGFEQGDAVLAFTGALLRKALVRHGSGDDFLGHTGGDDFILISTPERVAAIGRYVLTMFDRVVCRFYSPADRQKEALEGYDRQGSPVLAPLMGLSMAVLDCSGGELADEGRLGARVAGLKREAKAAGGSRLVRGGMGQAPLPAGENCPQAE